MPHREKTCLPGMQLIKPQITCSATETIMNIEIVHEASFYIILFNKRITKLLIKLRRCIGWSAPFLYATISQVFDEASI